MAKQLEDLTNAYRQKEKENDELYRDIDNLMSQLNQLKQTQTQTQLRSSLPMEPIFEEITEQRITTERSGTLRGRLEEQKDDKQMEDLLRKQD